ASTSLRSSAGNVNNTLCISRPRSILDLEYILSEARSIYHGQERSKNAPPEAPAPTGLPATLAGADDLERRDRREFGRDSADRRPSARGNTDRHGNSGRRPHRSC